MNRDSVINRIKFLSSSFCGLFQDLYAARLPDGVTRVEGCFLGYIADHQEEGVISSDIVRDFRLKKSTVSETLSSLERKGFILLAKDVNDGRRKLIVLAPKGVEHEHSAAPVMDEFDASFDDVLNEEENAQLGAIYEKLMDAIEERRKKHEKEGAKDGQNE